MINQLSLDALDQCLCKAEALAVVATSSNINTLDKHIISDYLWALSDLIHEARRLYDHA